MSVSPATSIATAVQAAGLTTGVAVAVPSGAVTAQRTAVMANADVNATAVGTTTMSVLASPDGGVTWVVTASQTWRSGSGNFVRGTAVTTPPQQTFSLPAWATHLATQVDLPGAVGFGDQLNFWDGSGNLL